MPSIVQEILKDHPDALGKYAVIHNDSYVFHRDDCETAYYDAKRLYTDSEFSIEQIGTTGISTTGYFQDA